MSVSRSSMTIGSVVVLLVLGSVAVAKYLSNHRTGDSGPFPDKDFSFGEAVQGQPVEHAFTVRNTGDSVLVLRRISPFGGVSLMQADTVIPAGGTGHVRLRFETQHKFGSIIELANVFTASDTVHPAATLRMRGRVVRALQFSPQDRVYFFAVAGEREQQDLELINHRERSLRVMSVTSDNPAFGVSHKTVTEGKRYRITVTLDPKVIPGKHEGRITVQTDDSAYASLPIIVNAFIDEKVSTTPKEVDFSTITLQATGDPVTGDKQVLVKKFRGTDFRVLRASTDLPFLDVRTAPHKVGESVLVTLQMNKQRAHRGPIRGTLTIETNDPAFPKIKVPIVGNVV